MTGLLDFSTNNFRNEFVNELLEVARGGFSEHDLDHLGSDLSNLRNENAESQFRSSFGNSLFRRGFVRVREGCVKGA